MADKAGPARPMVTLTVQTGPEKRFKFEAPIVGEADAVMLRRLWEAERAFNDLTGLRVHVDITGDGAGKGES